MIIAPSIKRSVIIAVNLIVILGFVSVAPEGYAATPLEFFGYTEAARAVVVSAPIQGQISEIRVQMGQTVQKGDVLIRLDDRQAALAVDLAQLQADAVGDIDLAKAELEMQNDRYIKLRSLAIENLARPDEVKRAMAMAQQSAARLQIAKEQREIKRGDLRRTKMQLRLHTIVSPINGLVDKVMHHEGEVVSPGDAAIIRLINVDWIEPVFSIPVTDLPAVLSQTDYRVRLRGAQQWVPASIDRISPSIHAGADTIQIRMRVENPDGIFRVGDSCVLQVYPDQNNPAEISDANAAWDEFSAIERGGLGGRAELGVLGEQAEQSGRVVPVRVDPLQVDPVQVDQVQMAVQLSQLRFAAPPVPVAVQSPPASVLSDQLARPAEPLPTLLKARGRQVRIVPITRISQQNRVDDSEVQRD